MREPCITPSGITYDRKDIEEHLQVRISLIKPDPDLIKPDTDLIKSDPDLIKPDPRQQQ
jgi:hypothetical protein